MTTTQSTESVFSAGTFWSLPALVLLRMLLSVCVCTVYLCVRHGCQGKGEYTWIHTARSDTHGMVK